MKKMVLMMMMMSTSSTSVFAEADCAERFKYEYGSYPNQYGYVSTSSASKFWWTCFGCEYEKVCSHCVIQDDTGMRIKKDCPQNKHTDEEDKESEVDDGETEVKVEPQQKKKKKKVVEVETDDEGEVEVELPQQSQPVTLTPKPKKVIPSIELPPDIPATTETPTTEEEIKKEVEGTIKKELDEPEPEPKQEVPKPKTEPPPEPEVIMAEKDEDETPGFFAKVSTFFSSTETVDVSWKRTFNDDKDALIAKVRAECEKNGVNPNFCEALGWTESKFELGLVSDKDARGILQMIPATATAYGCDPEQLQNVDVIIPCAVRLIKDLQQTYKGDFSLMASAYNAGEAATNYPSCLKRKRGCANTFKQTIEYIARVNAIMSVLEGRPVCDSHDCILFKPKAQADGPTDPLLLDLMVALQNEVPAFLWVSGCNDDYARKGIKTLHDEGKACDIGLYDQRYEKVAYAKVAEVIAKMGMTDKVKVKYNPGGKATTAPHVHIELRVNNNESPTTTMASVSKSGKMNIVVMGDSLAYGLCSVWETAVCHAKTGAFLRRIPADAIPINLPSDTMLVFWAGTNDAVADWGNFDMLQHVNGIMAKLATNQGKVVVMKIPDARPEMKMRIDKINMMFETAQESFPNITVMDAPKETKGKDKVHFTQQGYTNISKMIEQES